MENKIIEMGGITPETTEMVAQALSNKVMEGEVPALQMLAYLKAVEEAVKKVKTAINDVAIDEAMNEGKGEFTCFGCKMILKETGVKYDYSVVPSWLNTQRKIDALKDLQKEIEGKAKFASERSPYIDCDTETGEQTEILGIPRTSTTAVAVTLPKKK